MNKKTLAIGLAIFLMSGTAYLLWQAGQQYPQSPVAEPNSKTAEEAAQNHLSELSALTAEKPATTPPRPKPTASTPTDKLSYGDAVAKYDSNRIQFDATCQAIPNNVTYKSGTDVMFDNRANVARKIVFNGKAYNLDAYDYTVIKMTAASYPAIAYVDCAAYQNVAKVTIQK